MILLQGLNPDLDKVRGRLLETKPFPSLRESFVEVRREESKRRVMMNPSRQDVLSLDTRGSALVVNKKDGARGSQPNKQTGCDYSQNHTVNIVGN